MTIVYPQYSFPQDFQRAISLERHLVDLDISDLTVANLGAGSDHSAFTPQIAAFPFKKLYQVEIHEPYLISLAHVPYACSDVEFHVADIVGFVEYAFPCCVDVAILTDVLEHLDKKKALAMLETLRQRVKQRIIIWIPMGLCRQGEYDNNAAQEHLSEWSPEDFSVFPNTRIEYYYKFHRHIIPYADAAWINIDIE